MSDGEWLTYTEAARRLGTTPDAIRQRVKRGQMQGTRGNDGRPRVWSNARPNGQTAEQNPDKSLDSPNRTESEQTGQMKAMEAHVETLKAQLTRTQDEADKVRWRADELADRLRAIEHERAAEQTARAIAEAEAEAEAEADRLRIELDRKRQEQEQLVRVIEKQAAAVRQQGEQIKLLTDQRERRPWWRRLFKR
jgi:chromosome segregation ATPase